MRKSRIFQINSVYVFNVFDVCILENEFMLKFAINYLKNIIRKICKKVNRELNVLICGVLIVKALNIKYFESSIKNLINLRN